MKLHIEINTDRCTQNDATEINNIVMNALDSIMDTVAVQYGIPSRKKVAIDESLTVHFNVG